MTTSNFPQPGHELDEVRRRELEATLREAELRHRAFISLNSIAIWRLELEDPLSTELSIDQQIEYIYNHCYVAECNDAFARKHGFALANEVIGKGNELFNPREGAESIQMIRDFISSGYRLRNYETVKYYDDGSHRSFLSDYFGIVEGATLVRAWGSARDITEIREAKRAQLDSELQYRDIFEFSRTGISIRTTEGAIVAANPALCGMYGYTREEYMKKTGKELVHPDSLVLFQGLRETVLAGKDFRSEAQGVHKSGRVIDFEVYGTSMMYQGTPHILASLIDITERKCAQRGLQQSTEELRVEREALEQKNIALQQILEHLEKERETYRHEICESVEHLLMPVVEKLKDQNGVLRTKDIAVLEDTLSSIVAKDIDQFQSNMVKLSPRELDIVVCIRDGLASKEIASKLSISEQTVHKHRKAIRRKLQLSNKSINLAAYLRSR